MKKLPLFLGLAFSLSACAHTHKGLSPKNDSSKIDPTGIYQLVGEKTVACVEIYNNQAAPRDCSEYLYTYMQIIDVIDNPPRGHYTDKENIVMGMIFRESTIVTDNH